jgi:hypothetical protein
MLSLKKGRKVLRCHILRIALLIRSLVNSFHNKNSNTKAATPQIRITSAHMLQTMYILKRSLPACLAEGVFTGEPSAGMNGYLHLPVNKDGNKPNKGE